MPTPEIGSHEHDGFMFRVALGGGVGGLRQKLSGYSTTDLDGLAGTFSLDVGTTASENVVLQLRVADIAIRNPNARLNGIEVSAHDAWTGAGLFGAGATYYLMPANVYFTGALGVSWIRMRGPYDNDVHTTDTGVGLNADIGKEWWIDPQWGIGVAARFWYTRLSDRDKGDRIEYAFGAASIVFSATYQ